VKIVKQLSAVTGASLRTMRRRFVPSLVVVVGTAAVVGVLISVLAMVAGMAKTLENTGRADHAIVLRQGATTQISSTLPRSAADLVADAPGVARDSDGKAIVSAETIAITLLSKKGSTTSYSVPVQGVGPKFTKLRPDLQIIEGRMFTPGVNEVIAGKAAAAQFDNLEIGEKITIGTTPWTVVGTFASNGDAFESSLMTDSDTYLSTRPGAVYNSVTVALQSPATFQQFKDALSSNPSLTVDVLQEQHYFELQSEDIKRLLSTVAYIVGGVMAFGAIFAALNTMYSTVSTRVVEIATLRAMGYRGGVIVTSLLIEALLLALAGAVIGAAFTLSVLNGYAVSSSAAGGGTQLVFELFVSPQIVLNATLWACAIGLLGGLFPALRAARLPIAMGLRSS
jgi:putative ABC transport system permease protein